MCLLLSWETVALGMTQTAALLDYSNSPENLQQSMKLKTMGKYIKTKQHNNIVSSLPKPHSW